MSRAQGGRQRAGSGRQRRAGQLMGSACEQSVASKLPLRARACVRACACVHWLDVHVRARAVGCMPAARSTRQLGFSSVHR